MHSALAVAAALAVSGPESADATWCPTGSAVELVARSNDFRTDRGLDALEPDARLFVAADRLARDLARRGELTHIASDGSWPPDRAEAAGYVRTIVAENIAAGQTRVDQVIDGWADSPGHRKNMLDGRVRHAGAAHVTGRPACPRCPPHYWVLVVGASRSPVQPLEPGCRPAREG